MDTHHEIMYWKLWADENVLHSTRGIHLHPSTGIYLFCTSMTHFLPLLIVRNGYSCAYIRARKKGNQK